ncbi:MAG: site-2 protease family protein [Clostridiales bacterium]|nr:site-2 protease family protein [Clostridiales bacterium]
MLVAIVFFGFIIAIHEFGHFICAKLSGVKVNEFAIGMGPALFKHKSKETLYALRVLPIGGYVSMEGENDASEDERAFNNAKTWKKIIIVAAGATMNLILGLIIISIMLSINPLVGTNKIAAFSESATSASYGLQPGDEICKINGTTVYSSYDVSFLMMRDKDGVVDFTVKRNGEKINLSGVEFQTMERDGSNVIVFDFSLYGKKPNFSNVFVGSFKAMASFSRMIWLSLFDLVTGQFGFSQLSGPIGTVSVIAETASKSSFDSVLLLFAFITVNVGIFNLLPFPALDGGRLFFLLVELVRRKKVNPKYEGYVHAAGMALLMLMMVAVTFSDIVKLVKK